jgi:hypothetical protein
MEGGGGGGNPSGVLVGWCAMERGGGQAHSTVVIDKENTLRRLRGLTGEHSWLLALCMAV